MTSQGQRFRRRALRRGYKVDEVDAFLDRVEATLAGESVNPPVTAQEVHDVVFRVRFGGYDEWQVDLHLDRVERQLGEAEERTGGFARSGAGLDGRPAAREDQYAALREDRRDPSIRPGFGAPPMPNRPVTAMPAMAGSAGMAGSGYGVARMPGPAMGSPGGPGMGVAGMPVSPMLGTPMVPAPMSAPPMVPPQSGLMGPPMMTPQPMSAPPMRPMSAPPMPSGPMGMPGGPGRFEDPSRMPGGMVPGGMAHPGMAPGGMGHPGMGSNGAGGDLGGRRGRMDMTHEMRFDINHGMPTSGGEPHNPELQRIDAMRRTFTPRRFGSGYDAIQVNRLFDAIIASLSGRSGMPLNESELDPNQFSLVPGGYFEAEVNQALREVRGLVRR